jgi:hypothetical protein
MLRSSPFAAFILLLNLVLLVVLAVMLLLSQFQPSPHPMPKHYRTPSLGVSYTGLDYYTPTGYWNHCGNWTWLTSCYAATPSAGLSPQQQLQSDLAFIQQNHLGQFQRVWVMLDQGIVWSASGDLYEGLDSQYLANLDDALAAFYRAQIRVDLVLLEAEKGSPDQNQFQPHALDGQHARLRAGYLQALKDLAGHLAANTTDSQTVAVVDEMNEAYFQLERFGLSDDTIHAFLHDAYQALKAGDHALMVTASDTTRLLKNQGVWAPRYDDAVDVYDIHAYSDHPWNDAGFWARGRTLTKPWFVGEAGCAPGNVGCTYNGMTQCSAPNTCALSVDGWWLQHLRDDGAQAVLVEGRQTAWMYPGGPQTATPTLVGRMMQQYTLHDAARQ